jgi:hypothetical protein
MRRDGREGADRCRRPRGAMHESMRDGSGGKYVLEGALRPVCLLKERVPFQRIETWRRLSLPSRAQRFLGKGAWVYSISRGFLLSSGGVSVCAVYTGQWQRVAPLRRFEDFRAPNGGGEMRWAGLALLPALQTNPPYHSQSCRCQ